MSSDEPIFGETPEEELELARVIYESMSHSDPRPDDVPFDQIDDYDRQMYLMAAQRVVIRIRAGR